jgi:hypothetical protein
MLSVRGKYGHVDMVGVDVQGFEAVVPAGCGVGFDTGPDMASYVSWTHR